jgi:hypothetical protein
MSPVKICKIQIKNKTKSSDSIQIRFRPNAYRLIYPKANTTTYERPLMTSQLHCLWYFFCSVKVEFRSQFSKSKNKKKTLNVHR